MELQIPRHLFLTLQLGDVIPPEREMLLRTAYIYPDWLQAPFIILKLLHAHRDKGAPKAAVINLLLVVGEGVPHPVPVSFLLFLAPAATIWAMRISTVR